MAHGPTEDVRLGDAEAAQLVSDPQHLFLVEDYPIGAFQEIIQ